MTKSSTGEQETGGRPFCIADKPHFETLIALLTTSGAMCPKCGFGTRKTSKNWRRCKRCGERVKDIPIETITIKAREIAND